MDKKHKIIGVSSFAILFLAVAGWYLHRTNIPVLEPRGTIAVQEKHVLIIATLLMLLVVIPVFIITFSFAWKYRETNTKKAKYSPEWDHSRILETIWWLIPSALIVALSILTWRSTHQLDPFKPLLSTTPAITIQAVALDYKWLFIYPQQHIATVNYVEFPINTPVNFQITADAPMNSFWIPQLAGQIYAMPGMETQLHLSAFQHGDYRGSSANISGSGFSNMHFQVLATSAAGYQSWMTHTAKLTKTLNWSAYLRLAKPSEPTVKSSYGQVGNNLFSSVIEQYLTPAVGQSTTGSSSVMNGMVMQ
jgi:cytochrome o ubiquinol oxidase subunit 2